MKFFSHNLYAIFTAIVFNLAVSSVSAQRERNNIFLFDCTRSMKESGLWTPALNALDATISTQSQIPDSRFIIIPFGDCDYRQYEFMSGDYSKKESEIKKGFEEMMSMARNTHITPVLQKGFNQCDPSMENKIYLLTDGKPNDTDSPEKVATLISQWCGQHRNTRLFYVALNDKAVSPIIEKEIDNCPDAYIVKCSDNVIPQIEDLSSVTVNANIKELDNVYELSFSSPGSYPVDVRCDDAVFSVEVVDGKINDRRLRLKINPRDNLSVDELHNRLKQLNTDADDYVFRVNVSIPDSRFFIANPDLTVYMADHIQSKLSLGDGSNDELKLDKAEWYDSFLWSDAAKNGTTEYDLSPVFSNHTSNSKLGMTLRTEDGGKMDYTLYFNGDKISPGNSFEIIPGKPAKLKIVFNADAQEGKRYFNLVPTVMSDLDLVNGQGVEQYEGLPLRTKYEVVWNPLRTVLMWMGILILVALLVWLIILRRLFFPTMKASKIILTGPHAYYKSMCVKGSIKAVFTTKQEKQGFFSNLFKGNIIYVTAPHFIPQIEVTPGSKKKVRFRSVGNNSDGWNFIPSFILAPNEKCEAVNNLSKERFNIEVQ